MHGNTVQRSRFVKGSPERYWVQPKADVLHLNQNQRCMAYTDTDGGHASPVGLFLESAAALNMSVSLSHRILANFARPDVPASFSHSEAVADLQVIAQMGPEPLEVVVQKITLHIDRDVGARSDLFGLFGEELLQSVDVWDTARIGRYRSLWESSAAPQDIKLKDVFNRFEASDQLEERLNVWLERVYYRLIGAMWSLSRAQDFDHAELTEGVWHPPPEKGRMPASDINKLNLDHPWVVELVSRLPKIRPKIMFWHCFSWHCRDGGR